jgi:hypothetical protein
LHQSSSVLPETAKFDFTADHPSRQIALLFARNA